MSQKRGPLQPPHAPEFDAIDRLRRHLDERCLSYRRWADEAAIVDTVRRARQRVTADAGRIETVCCMEWARAVTNG